MITIVNYGSGNIRAITNILTRLGVAFTIAGSPPELESATRILLPGVGAFDHAMGRLEQSGLRRVLDVLVLERKIPVLGICVGMQILGASSEEGRLPGLGWVKGVVKKFDISKAPGGNRMHLPHMGWNDVEPIRKHHLFEGLEENARFYFLHSYYFHCVSENDMLARSEYGGPFACAISHENILGVQFHPEKSHRFGIRLLKNFAHI